MSLLILLGQVARADISANMPLDHWGYALIERFEAKGVLREVQDGIRPLSRREMARLLMEIGKEEEQALSRIDRQQLGLLRRELRKEIEGLGGGKVSGPDSSLLGRLKGGDPLLGYEGEEGEVQVDLLIRQQTDLFTGRGRRDTERIFRNRLGGLVRGELRGQVGFYIAFEQTREQGSRSYWIRDDLFERRVEIPQLKGDLTDYHEGIAYLTFSLPFCDVEVGKDRVAWGPGPEDELGLSDNAPSFDMLRIKSRLGPFKLVSIAGALRPCPDRADSPLCWGMRDSSDSYVVNGMSRTLDREKYLAAHRLEVAAAPWLDLGFQEVVVYGDRGPEVAYLNPVMFYWAAQSYLGDKDNLMMGVDADLHPGNGLKLYLAYVVDDLKKLKVFSSDFANKFSLQAGLFWTDPLGVRDADLWVEYVRIEPWIYTHKFPINTFRHFDAPLGHALGPNSDQWKIRLTRRLSRDVSVAFEGSRIRHGDNELLPDGTIRNVGGDLHLGWRPGDRRDSKHFLDGNLGKRTRVGGFLSARIGPFLSLKVGYDYEWSKNVPLPPRWGPNVLLANRTGYGDGGQQHFYLDLRYHCF